MFEALSRQSFRRYFQPSRILLGVLPDEAKGRHNVITLCFHMHCSYKPPMMAFSVWHGSHSFSLLNDISECVLAVPGEKLADAAMFCGVNSGKKYDKASAAGLTFTSSQHVNVPSIKECIANLELIVTNKVLVGDHMTIFGAVRRFGVDRSKSERSLISVGPFDSAYEVLVRKGIHRIAVPKAK